MRQNELVSEAEVQESLQWLFANAVVIGEARRAEEMAEQRLKHVEAARFGLSEEKSADARKCAARTSPQYVEAYIDLARAKGETARMYALKAAHEMRVEVWRSMCANLRQVR